MKETIVKQQEGIVPSGKETSALRRKLVKVSYSWVFSRVKVRPSICAKATCARVTELRPTPKPQFSCTDARTDPFCPGRTPVASPLAAASSSSPFHKSSSGLVISPRIARASCV